jgi:uncharacterized protein YbaR (Trm112 family)
MEARLMELICAPLTHAPVRLVNAQELSVINQSIQSQLIRNRAGELLQSELKACLICDSDRICYPILDDLPVMIPDAAFYFPDP